MVPVLCGFTAECLKTSRNFTLPFENTMKTHLADLLYFYIIGLCSMFFTKHFTRPKSKLITGSIPVLDVPEKSIIPSFRYISVVMSYLLWALGRI